MPLHFHNCEPLQASYCTLVLSADVHVPVPCPLRQGIAPLLSPRPCLPPALLLFRPVASEGKLYVRRGFFLFPLRGSFLSTRQSLR